MTKITAPWAICAGLATVVNVFAANVARAQESSKIACSASKLVMAPMDTCFKGPTGAGSSNRCFFERYSAFGTTNDRAAYARAVILNTQETPTCYVTDPPDLAADMRNANNFTTQGAKNWSAVQDFAGVRGMHFDFPKRKCFVYFADGPRWGGGYVYNVVAYVCGPLEGQSPTEAEVAAFVASVHVTPAH